MYFSILKNSDIILETHPAEFLSSSAKTPTLNIGNRQLGRIFSPSIFQCDLDENQIYKKIFKI